MPRPSHPRCPARQDCALQSTDSDDHGCPRWTTCSVPGHLTRRVTCDVAGVAMGTRRGVIACSGHTARIQVPGRLAWGPGTEPLSEKTAVERLAPSAGPQQCHPPCCPHPTPSWRLPCSDLPVLPPSPLHGVRQPRWEEGDPGLAGPARPRPGSGHLVTGGEEPWGFGGATGPALLRPRPTHVTHSGEKEVPPLSTSFTDLGPHAGPRRKVRVTPGPVPALPGRAVRAASDPVAWPPGRPRSGSR